MLLLTLTLAFAPLTDWHVDIQGTTPGSGTLADPYTSIEYAIAQPTTVPGDRILVAPGTYTGETIDFLGKELSIEAAQGPGTVTVQGPYTPSTGAHTPGSGGQALIRVVQGEGPGTRIAGIDFVDGAGEDLGTEVVGGAVFVSGSTLELENCSLLGYARTKGGAVYCQDADLTLRNTQIDGRVTDPQATLGVWFGGGSLWASHSTLLLESCSVQGFAQTGPSSTVEAQLMWLEQSNTTIDGGTLKAQSACQFNCRANSIIQVVGGQWTLRDTVWDDIVGAVHLVHAQAAMLDISGVDWSIGVSLHHGRSILADDCDTSVRDCTFVGSDGSIGDFAPFTSTSGGHIHHTGSLLVEDCLFQQNGHVRGGALYADQLVLRDSTFLENYARCGWTAFTASGGAVEAGSATIENCRFENNQARNSVSTLGSFLSYTARGGALYLFGPSTIRDCEFVLNRAESVPFWISYQQLGGAVYAEAPIRIFDSTFEQNEAIVSSATLQIGNDAKGGALYLEQGGYLEGCTFGANTARSPQAQAGQAAPFTSAGGAVFSESGALTLKNCRLQDNAAEQGAALFVESPGSGLAEQCVFAANELVEYPGTPTSPLGAAWHGMVTAQQCTLVDQDLVSSGGDLVSGGSLDSCIVWGNQPLGLPAGAQATYSTVEGMAPGLGNSDEDPLFWAVDDLHLLPASPAIDAGNPALFDDDGSRADRGAYAFDPAYCGTLCAVPLGIEPCASNANSLGVTAAIGAYGSSSVSDQFLTLAASQVPEGSCGYFLASESGDFVPLFGGSQGNLCLGGSIYRMHDVLLTANSGNRVGRRVALDDLAYGNMVLPGSTWHFQLWFRDSGCTSTQTNTSGSVAIQF